MSTLVITADDFGLAKEVNEAVEYAHRKGVLSAASLMVSGPAAAHAIALAKRMPALRVGLHLVLVEGQPTLPPEEVCTLVGRNGRFQADMVKAGFRLALSAHARRQLVKEMTAQFAAFRSSGERLDHVNAHKHFHLHPLVGRELLRVGKTFGMRAVRVPLEPSGVLAQIERRRIYPQISDAWARLLRNRAAKARLVTAGAVFGLRRSGGMTADHLRGLLQNLPDGLVEVYMHPASANRFPGHAAGYRYTDELAALVEPQVIAAAKTSGRRLGGYADAA